MQKIISARMVAVAALTLCMTATAAHAFTNDKDKDFYETASQGSKAEIALAHLALQKSLNHDVRLFAQKMIHDHTKLIENMKPIAKKLGASSPEDLSLEAHAEVQKLQSLSGNEFSREYLRMMVEDHHKDLRDFQAGENETTDPVVKRNVHLAGAVIEQHVKIIDQLAKNNSIQP